MMDLSLFIAPQIPVRDWRKYNIVKVPWEVYQVLYDIALAQGATWNSRRQLMLVLEEWAEDKFPGQTMTASVELSKAEAEELKGTYPGIEWGIYIKIAPISSLSKSIDTCNTKPYIAAPNLELSSPTK